MENWKSEDGNIKLINGDCLEVMDLMIENGIKVDMIVTSPPYYNAREYSQWKAFEDYLKNMKEIFTKAFEFLNNHRHLILNVGDIVSRLNGAKWNKKRLMLGARFICMLEDIGFEIIDDYIWDKGEPQTKRHLGNPPYPFYNKPVNCYEHIIIAEKNILDKTKIPCPDCNEIKTVSNSQTKINVQSWECKNPNCNTKSKSNRGKRFSKRSIMMNDYKKEENLIDNEFIKKWRRDIIKINPVIKINSKGENKLGHTAPFPLEIPEMACRFFSGVGDIVCDIFSGSGTTGIVCKNLNRKFIGIEKVEEYYNISIERIKEANND